MNSTKNDRNKNRRYRTDKGVSWQGEWRRLIRVYSLVKTNVINPHTIWLTVGFLTLRINNQKVYMHVYLVKIGKQL